MGDWNIFWYAMAFIGLLGVIAAIYTPRINKAMEKLEYFANGHVTEHHRYQPFD